MPSRRRLCQEAHSLSHRVAPHGSGSPLWITDDVLGDAFTRFLRFSHGAKRYGSNVPGPLEAQRRLAKRRMMGLTGVGASPGVDPAIMFGAGGPKLDKVVWQSPRDKKLQASLAENEKDSKSARDDSWLTRLGLISQSTPSRPPHSKHKDVVHQGIFKIQRIKTASGTPRQRWHDLHDDLKDASVAEMPALLRRAEEQGFDRADFSRRAFGFLLHASNEMRWAQLLDFLLNPELNIPDEHFLTFIVSDLGKKPLRLNELNESAKLVESCIKLGVVSDEEIPKLVEAAFKSMKHVHIHLEDLVNRTDSKESPEYLIEAIWRGLCACSVKSGQLQQPTARLILESMYQDKGQLSFRFELYQAAYPIGSQAQEEGLKHGVVERYLAAWALQACDPTSTSQMNVTVLTYMLEDLHPTTITPDHLVKATDILFKQHAKYNVDRARLWDAILNGWLMCLQKSLAYRVWSPVLTLIASKDISPLDLGDFFTRLVPRHLIGEVLIVHWMPKLPILQPKRSELKLLSLHYVATQGTQASSLVENVVMERVLKDYRFLHQQARSPYAHDAFTFLLIVLARHERNNLYIQQLLFALAERLFGPAGLAQICDHARSAGVWMYPQYIANMLPRIVTEQPKVALSLYKSRKIHIDVKGGEMCSFLKALIEGDVHSIEIFRILDFDDPWHYVPVEEREKKRNDLSEERVDLVHDVATAFSKRDHELRVAFRNVYFCYTYLNDKRAPLDARMSRALVRSGITNYLKNNVNVGLTQVKWVLSIVEKIEGEQIAKELDELVGRWLEKVYARCSLLPQELRLRRQIARPAVALRRRKSGSLANRVPHAWLVASGRMAKRVKWHLPDGEVQHTDLEEIWDKRKPMDQRHGFMPRGQRGDVVYLAQQSESVSILSPNHFQQGMQPNPRLPGETEQQGSISPVIAYSRKRVNTPSFVQKTTRTGWLRRWDSVNRRWVNERILRERMFDPRQRPYRQSTARHIIGGPAWKPEDEEPFQAEWKPEPSRLAEWRTAVNEEKLFETELDAWEDAKRKGSHAYKSWEPGMTVERRRRPMPIRQQGRRVRLSPFDTVKVF